MHALRIFMTGVGGQGTLTATTLLARTAVDEGLHVSSGEIHGMAQRGGVVESTLLINCESPKIAHGEADILLGFEALETLRAIPYLKKNGHVFSSTNFLAPLSIATGKNAPIALEDIQKHISLSTNNVRYIPTQDIGIKAGAVQSGNTALLAILCASNLLPFNEEALKKAIIKYMPEKIASANIKALELGIEMLN